MGLLIDIDMQKTLEPSATGRNATAPLEAVSNKVTARKAFSRNG